MERLEKLIDDNGIKRVWLADQLGISIQALRLKLKGRYKFNTVEIGKLKEILNLSADDVIDIFLSK